MRLESLKCDRKGPFPGEETVLFCFIRDTGQGSAGGYGIRPYGAGAMLVIPNKSLKQKIPEQTFEDFGADEGI